MIFLYALPFTILTPYLWDGNYEWTFTPAQMRYSHDRLLLAQLVAVATAGLLGLIVGIHTATARSNNIRRISTLSTRVDQKWRTLNRLPYSCALVTAWLLSWLSAPTKNILAATYYAAGTQATSERLNFNSAALISYLILILLFVDAERDLQNRSRQRWKFKVLLATAALIIVYFQAFRGNRDSAGLIVALAALYLTGPSRQLFSPVSRAMVRRRIKQVAVPTIIIAVGFIALGSARHSLTSSTAGTRFDVVKQLRDGWTQSTWKGVLLTNLSISAQYRQGRIQYLSGQTYVDNLISLPPGAVASLAGLHRPIESRNPSTWTKDIASGGAQAVIIPFKNFGIVGAFIILCAYGYGIARLEQWSSRNSFWGRLLFGAVATSSFLWFWYGDTGLIRALAVASILGLAYQSVCRTRRNASRATHAPPGHGVLTANLASRHPS